MELQGKWLGSRLEGVIVCNFDGTLSARPGVGGLLQEESEQLDET